MSKPQKGSYRKHAPRKQKQRNNRSHITAAILLVIALALFAFALRSSFQEIDLNSLNTAPIQGYQAPIFTADTLSGGEISLQNYADEVVVVNFWATWCPPCKAEMPGINAFYQAYQDRGLVVLAVNVRESEATVRPFIETSSFTFPVLLDPAGKIVDQYQVRSFPTTLIIDRDGVIQYIHTGMISPEELEAVVTPLL